MIKDGERSKVKCANLKILKTMMEKNFTLKIGKSKRFVVHPPSLKFRWAGGSRLKDRGQRSVVGGQPLRRAQGPDEVGLTVAV
jgi:hypothetical protein